jgi:uncharacterized protein
MDKIDNPGGNGMVWVGFDPRIALVGLVVGTFVGLSGVGGGSLVTPLLILVLRVNPAIAVGTDLLYSVPTKLVGAIVHHRQGTVEWRVVRLLATGGLPGALLGLAALATLQQRLGLAAVNGALRHALAPMLAIAALAILAKPLLTRRATGERADAPWAPDHPGRLVALGALVGLLVSLTSIGSGSLTVPLLYFLVPRLALRRLVGADVAFAALLVPVAAAGHWQLGHVDVGLAANLALGSLPGVVLGSRLCLRVPDVWFRPALAGVLIFAGSRLL